MIAKRASAKGPARKPRSLPNGRRERRNSDFQRTVAEVSAIRRTRANIIAATCGFTCESRSTRPASLDTYRYAWYRVAQPMDYTSHRKTKQVPRRDGPREDRMPIQAKSPFHQRRRAHGRI